MGSGTYSFSVAQTGNSMAYVYVDKLPVFMNQPMEVMVEENNMTRINADSGSFANMGITLQSVNGNSVKVEITPLEASLGLAPDTARISTVNNMLLANGRKNVTTSITTTATTTVASTTTVSQINTTSANIMAALKKNKSYAVMQNYTVLYANSANCTQSKYNSAYLKYYGVMPTRPELPERQHVPAALWLLHENDEHWQGQLFVRLQVRIDGFRLQQQSCSDHTDKRIGLQRVQRDFRGHIRRPDLSWNTRWLQ